MKYKKAMLCSVLFLGLGLFQASAQVALPASGGNISGSGGSVSYSIGQVSFSSYREDFGSVDEGIQCAYEITVVSDMMTSEITENTEMLTTDLELIEVSPELYAYPNPTTDVLTLRIDSYNGEEGMLYQLMNSQGRILESKDINSSLTSISMIKLAREAYFLRVIHGKQSIKTFKIIKY